MDYPSGLNPYCNTCKISLHISMKIYPSNSLCQPHPRHFSHVIIKYACIKIIKNLF
ncbi:hypothetical protein F383_12455 [Gossypium arboreum]|uniref:Uncharacterized protein n=1 Tax=Gossypium arboreum TaxID=29729 RepID=A0A0B0PVT4_GOSAR|nr:hypothetical protein F383_12455 [Gossypium arboreum]